MYMSSTDLRRRLPEVLEIIKKGITITVTKHGKTVAVVSLPAGTAADEVRSVPDIPIMKGPTLVEVVTPAVVTTQPTMVETVVVQDIIALPPTNVETIVVAEEPEPVEVPPVEDGFKFGNFVVRQLQEKK